MVLTGDQPQVTLGNGDGRITHQAAQDRHAHMTGHGLLQIAQVTRAAQMVEKDAGKGQLVVESLEPLHQGGGTACHGARAHHQNHRQPQPFGHLGRGTGFAAAIIAVEKPHDAFHHGDVRTGGMPGKGRPVVSLGEHPAVQVAADPPGDPTMMARIDEVRPHLEGGHGVSPVGQSGHQAQGDGGFTGSAVGSGDDDAFDTSLLLTDSGMLPALTDS
ncbi:hypothetical protein DESC_870106 [Desulfosarcina cetonica]|nr:hypothetical protein DESC_870106 [Desulfosarcina cetonica]